MVENKNQRKVKEFKTLLELERNRKTNEVKIETARRILGGDEFSFANEEDVLETVDESDDEKSD